MKKRNGFIDHGRVVEEPEYFLGIVTKGQGCLPRCRELQEQFAYAGTPLEKDRAISTAYGQFECRIELDHGTGLIVGFAKERRAHDGKLRGEVHASARRDHGFGLVQQRERLVMESKMPEYANLGEYAAHLPEHIGVIKKLVNRLLA